MVAVVKRVQKGETYVKKRKDKKSPLITMLYIAQYQAEASKEERFS